MTMMADFLLQPTPASNSARTAGRDADLGSSTRPSVGGQDFSRMLVQQRQAADVRPPAPPRSQTETPRQPDTSRAENRRDDKVAARPAEARPNRESRQATTDEAKPAASTDRQKDDASAVSGADNASADAVLPENVDGMTETPGLLDPLLEHAMQAPSAAQAAGDLEDGEPAEGSEVVSQLLAMIQGSAVSADKTAATSQPHALAGGNSARQAEPAAAALANATNKADSEGQELDLSFSEPGEELPLASQLLAATAAKPERSETLASQSSPLIEKGVSVGEARTDTLMRSEAVQSAQATRQVPGEPLNMQQPGWSKELTDKVMWMSSQNLKSAEIKLNPAELGRIDIRVQVGQEHTQITFASAHAGVRDSLDGQMHRLREMLEQQGMHNVDVEVADQSQQREQHNDNRGVTGGLHAGQADEELVAVSEVEQQEQGHAGLVSYYV